MKKIFKSLGAALFGLAVPLVSMLAYVYFEWWALAIIGSILFLANMLLIQKDQPNINVKEEKDGADGDFKGNPTDAA